MNPRNQLLSQFIDQSALRISLSGAYIGSGFAVYSINRKYVYIFTARHCLAEADEPLPALVDISLEWYDSLNGVFIPCPFIVEQGAYIDFGDDLLGIGIDLIKTPVQLPDRPQISIGVDVCDVTTSCSFKGFPVISAHNAFTVQCQYAERLGIEFAVEVDRSFESNRSLFAQESTGAFSGSGVIMTHEGKTILIGICKRN